MRANNRAQVVCFFVFVFFGQQQTLKLENVRRFKAATSSVHLTKKNSITERISAAAGGCTSLGYKGQMKRPTLH